MSEFVWTTDVARSLEPGDKITYRHQNAPPDTTATTTLYLDRDGYLATATGGFLKDDEGVLANYWFSGRFVVTGIERAPRKLPTGMFAIVRGNGVTAGRMYGGDDLNPWQVWHINRNVPRWCSDGWLLDALGPDWTVLFEGVEP